MPLAALLPASVSMRIPLLLIGVALVPGVLFAQQQQQQQEPVIRFGPDSAEYLFTNTTEGLGPDTPRLEQRMRARVVATALGADSLHVVVTMLEQKMEGVPDDALPGTPPPLELRVARSGYTMPDFDPAHPTALGTSLYPHLFARMILGASQAGLEPRDLARQVDSLKKIGMQAEMHEATLTDTTVRGVQIRRRGADMLVTSNDANRVPWDSTVRVPPMKAELHVERWTDASGRLFLSVMRNHAAPVGKTSEFPEMVSVMRMERVGP